MGGIIIVNIRNYSMGRQKEKERLNKFGKKMLSLMVVIVAIMAIIPFFSTSAFGLFSISLFFSVLIFTGSLWLTKNDNNEINERLDKIDCHLGKIEDKIDSLKSRSVT